MNRSVINEYIPDFVSPPGDTLQEILDSIGMSQRNLAERMGRPYKTINEIIKAKTAITPETAIQLEKVLDIPATFWINRESIYREHIAKVEDRMRLQEHLCWLDNFPIKEMVKFRWIRKFTDKVSQLKELLKFFGVASPHEWESIYSDSMIQFRKTKKESDKLPYLLSSWLRQGELQARGIELEEYDKNIFYDNLQEIKNLTNESPDKFVPQMTARCAASGVALVFVPELKGLGVWGATRFLSNHSGLIQISLRYKTNDHLWFTFFHEAGHIILHGKNHRFLETDDQPNGLEDEANTFARDLLIPPKQYTDFISRRVFSEDSIIKFADNINIAPGIVVGRLQHDQIINYKNYNYLKKRYEWST